MRVNDCQLLMCLFRRAWYPIGPDLVQRSALLIRSHLNLLNFGMADEGHHTDPRVRSVAPTTEIKLFSKGCLGAPV
jgi:hypothetical protein